MDYEYRAEVLLELRSENTPPKNKTDDRKMTSAQLEILRQYYFYRKNIKKFSVKTLYNDVIELRRLAVFNGKPFDEMTKRDIQSYVASRNNLKALTVNSILSVILTFFKYLYDTDEKPDCVKWITFNRVQEEIKPDDVLTTQEIDSMIAHCKNDRDKTIIAMLYDTGCRIGELIEHSHFGDIKQDKRGYYIRVNGKTGERRIRLKDSIPYVINYINNHPTKNPESPLFMTHNGRISNKHVSTIIIQVAKKTGIEKRVHPHLLRHSKVTHISPLLSDQILKKQFGWTKSSRMVEKYVHISEEAHDLEICKAYGIDVPSEEIEKHELATINCSVCGIINPFSNHVCFNCRRELHVDEQQQYVEEDYEGKMIEIMQKWLEEGKFGLVEKMANRKKMKQLDDEPDTSWMDDIEIPAIDDEEKNQIKNEIKDDV
ncbi:tyrosine-type recombinase/integrase [Methanolobus sp.]|uniref:tyrosine-type recombinase/integrase n=1 Tax=Methanolobus sp. TaxID=1874737 RepID=UPI0025FBB907|nr:tyrosine-type recombinase/integrase [Methanolobus sp.]